MEPATYAAGWYPDPSRRFEYRYHNGERWTADVSSGGARYVDPLPPAATPTPSSTSTPLPTAIANPPTFNAPPSRGMAISAFVIALCSLAVAWIPFLFVLGAGGAVAAFTLGVVVMRRSARSSAAGTRTEIGQGMAIASVVIAVAAAALCIVGFMLTRVVLRAVDEFVNPGPHSVQIDSCESEGGRVIAQGSIRNNDTEQHGYTISVTFAVGSERIGSTTVLVFDVAPGSTSQFDATSREVTFSAGTATCTVESVYGPTPLAVSAQEEINYHANVKDNVNLNDN